MKYLVDSNIIIYHLNGHRIATEFLSEHDEEIAISQITLIEVMSFPFSPEEEKIVSDLLMGFRLIDVDTEISLRAIENQKRKKIKIPDNIIASTAMVHDLVLVTRNTKDFNSLSIKLYDPFEEKAL